jgi:hypothetical protein
MYPHLLRNHDNLGALDALFYVLPRELRDLFWREKIAPSSSSNDV